MMGDASANHSRIPALDGLRGLAILLVLLFHTAPGGQAFLPGGFLGVDLFFVLSGFLITSLLLQERKRTGTISLRQFYLRRALRLFPALAVLLLAVAMYATARLPEVEQGKVYRGILASTFYYSNWILSREQAALHMLNHTWSLSIEEQFYICFPLCISILLARGASLKLLACILALSSCGSALLMALYYVGPETYFVAYERTDSHMAPILLGALVAVLRFESVDRRSSSWIGILALGGILALSVFANFRDAFMYRGGFYLFAMCSAYLVGELAFHPNVFLSSFFSHPICQWLGRISYGLYLWHFPIFVAISNEDPGPQGWGHFSAGLFLSFLCAALSYYFVEQPCLKLKRRFGSVPLEQPAH